MRRPKAIGNIPNLAALFLFAKRACGADHVSALLLLKLTQTSSRGARGAGVSKDGNSREPCNPPSFETALRASSG
jgi:hypothetical protein